MTLKILIKSVSKQEINKKVSKTNDENLEKHQDGIDIDVHFRY